MILRLSRILEVAADRPPGYFQELLAAGTVEGEFLHLPDESAAALRAKYRPAAPAPAARVRVRLAGTTTDGHLYQGTRRIQNCRNCPS